MNSKGRNCLVLALFFLIFAAPPVFNNIKMRFMIAKVPHLSGPERYKIMVMYSGYLYPAIKVGMSKSEVKKVLGSPDNNDGKSVWIWSPGGAGDGKSKSWKELHEKYPGYFVVFYDDILVSRLLKCVEGTPREVLQNRLGWSVQAQDEISKLLEL